MNMISSSGALPILPAVTQISSRIIRILGANPSPYTLQGTNSYLLGRKKSRWLIDTSNPNMTEYLENLKRTLKENDAIVSNILITHWHEDHIGALPEVKALCLELGGKSPKAFKYPGGPQPSWAKNKEASDLEILPLTDNQVIKVDEETTLRVLFTPGHTKDHVALWLEEEQILFSGDMILGHGSSVFESLTDYMKSLKHVQKLSPPWLRILSAHGAEIKDAEAVISGYLSHREGRISQVSDCLSTSAWMTKEAILDKVYPGLVDNLKFGALNNIQHALTYLKDMGRAQENNSGEWKLCADSKL